MMNIMKYILLLSITSSALGQINLVARTGFDVPVDKIFDDNGFPLARYWSTGIGASLSAEYAITPRCWIVPSFQYAHYRWDNYNYGGPMIPEDYVVSASGDNSEVYRFLVEGRFLASRQFIAFHSQLYFTTGLAYTIENIGVIHTVTGNTFDHLVFLQTINYPNRDYWSHTVGIGIRTDIAGPIAFDLSAKYLTDYTRTFYTCYAIGVAYSLF